MLNIVFFFLFLIAHLAVFAMLHALIRHLAYPADARFLHNRLICALILLLVIGANFYTWSGALYLVSYVVNLPSLRDFWLTVLPQRSYKLLFMLLEFLGTNLLVMAAAAIVLSVTKLIFARADSFHEPSDFEPAARILHIPWLLTAPFYRRDENNEPALKGAGFTCGLWARAAKKAFLIMGICETLLTAVLIIFAPDSMEDALLTAVRAAYFLPAFGYLLMEQLELMLYSEVEAEAGTFSSEEIGRRQRGNIGALTSIYDFTFRRSKALLYSGFTDQHMTEGEGLQSNDLGRQQLEDCAEPDVLLMLSSQLRDAGVRQNDAFQNVLVALLNGRSVNVRDNIRGEFLTYLAAYLNYYLSQGKSALLLAGDASEAEEMRRALTERLGMLNNIYSIWRIRTIEEADTDVEMNILVCSCEDFLNYHIVDKRRDFIEDLFCVCFLRGMTLFTQDAIRIERLFSELGRVENDLIFIMESDVDNDSLRNACELYIKKEMVPFRSDALHVHTHVMVWRQESAYRLQKWLGLGDDYSFYMGSAIPLALVGVRYDMPRIHILGSSDEGEMTYQEVATMSRNEIETYLGGPKNLRSIIRYNDDEALSEHQIAELIAFDRDFNILNVLWQWLKYGGQEGTLLHIISPPYLLRDYLANNFNRFVLRNNSYDAIVPYSHLLRQTRMSVLLMELCDTGMTEERLMAKNSEYGWGYEDPVILLSDCLTTVLNEGEVHGVLGSFLFREETHFLSDEGGFVKETRITLTDEHIRERLLEKCALATVVEKGDQESDLPVLRGNLYNYYLRDQIIPIGGYLARVRAIADGRLYVEQVKPQDAPDYCVMSDADITLTSHADAGNDTEMMDWDLYTGSVTRRIYGYWSTNNGTAFVGEGTGILNNLTDAEGGAILQHFDDVSILRLSMHREALGSRAAEAANLAVFMMNEIFKTLFPRNYQNLLAFTEQAPDEGFWERILYTRSGRSSDDVVRSLIPFMRNGSEDPDAVHIYVAELSVMEFGLVKALYENRQRLLAIMVEYLEWYLTAPSGGDKSGEGASLENENTGKNANTVDNDNTGKSADTGNNENAGEKADSGETAGTGKAGDRAEESAKEEERRHREEMRSYLRMGMTTLPGIFDALALYRVLKSGQLHHVEEGLASDGSTLTVKPEYRCTFCGKPSLFVTELEDGRRMCNDCADHQIRHEEIKDLFKETVRFLEDGYHIRFRKNIHVRFQSADTIRRAAGDKSGGRVLGFYQPSSHQLWIETCGPRISVQDTLIHELTHTWQFDNLPLKKLEKKLTPRAYLALIEGHAVYMEIDAMRRMNEFSYADYVHEEMENRNDEYGVGYRMLEDYLKSRGGEGSHMTPYKAMEELADKLLSGEMSIDIE